VACTNQVEEDERYEDRRHQFAKGHMVHSYARDAPHPAAADDDDAVTPFPAAPPAAPAPPSPPLPVYTSQQAANSLKNPLLQIHRSTAAKGDEVRSPVIK
jgi:hypothetical protein